MDKSNTYIMQQILDAAQLITYNNLDDAKESLQSAINDINAYLNIEEV